jgi:hypothetical protein
MAFAPPARHLLRAKDLADARYFDPIGVDDMAHAAGPHFEKTGRPPDLASPATVQVDQGDTMIKLANAQLWVHDQEEALAFYTEKVGMEVRTDVTLAELGDFRWLSPSACRARTSRSC